MFNHKPTYLRSVLAQTNAYRRNLHFKKARHLQPTIMYTMQKYAQTLLSSIQYGYHAQCSTVKTCAHVNSRGRHLMPTSSDIYDNVNRHTDKFDVERFSISHFLVVTLNHFQHQVHKWFTWCLLKTQPKFRCRGKGQRCYNKSYSADLCHFTSYLSKHLKTNISGVKTQINRKHKQQK